MRVRSLRDLAARTIADFGGRGLGIVPVTSGGLVELIVEGDGVGAAFG